MITRRMFIAAAGPGLQHGHMLHAARRSLE
jgi:hypothetical protein